MSKTADGGHASQPSTLLRRRKKHSVAFTRDVVKRDEENEQKRAIAFPVSGANEFWLTRVLLLRALSFVYAAAFISALRENRHLLGQNGLTPVDRLFQAYGERLGVQRSGLTDFSKVYHALRNLPTLMWWSTTDTDDVWLTCMSVAGIVLSAVILVTGAANALAMLLLWLLYTSIVNVGQIWYSFGWESQLLETGFLAIFAVPLYSWTQMPLHVPPPAVLIWGYRWLGFRVMMGAGLIKLRGDDCWWDLTCMHYHYQTQPNPNPVAWLFHQSPSIIHEFEVAAAHLVELILPWFVLFPRPFRIFNGVVQILFQLLLILSGNFAFLNWLTIVPALACLDDKFWRSYVSADAFQRSQLRYRQIARGEYREKAVRKTTYMSLSLLILYLSIPVVENLISPRQLMNTSYEPLRIVNSYGYFGKMTRTRTEIVVLGTSSDNPSAAAAVWKEYDFKCKPGPTKRMPCVVTPLHYRLDWLMWFASFQIFLGVVGMTQVATASHGGHSTTHRKQDDHGNYHFGYHITDGYGAKNGREEHGDGYGNKKGSYYLQDVDGRWRKVDYVADGHGFRARIHTNEPGTTGKDAAHAEYNGPHSEGHVPSGSHGHGHHHHHHHDGLHGGYRGHHGY